MNSKDVILLSKCINMLSSKQDGEVLSAASAIVRIQSNKQICLVTILSEYGRIKNKTLYQRIFKWKK